MGTLPSPSDHSAELVGEAIVAIYEFAGPHATTADAAHLMAHWRHRHRLGARQLAAVVAAFTADPPPAALPEHVDGFPIAGRGRRPWSRLNQR